MLRYSKAANIKPLPGIFKQVILITMYVCMYCHHIYQSMNQPGKVANPARGQLNRENEHSPVPVRA